VAENIENKQQFEDVIVGDNRVVIKFYADWCPDCRRMDFFIGSVLEQLPAFPFYEVDRDNIPELVEKYEVMGIPSLLVFENGQKIGHLHSANAKTPEEVTTFLSEYFSTK
jgi:thioredoxin 1